MTTTPVPPKRLTYNGAFRRMLEQFTRHPAITPGTGVPLWSIAAGMCGLGSTSAMEMLEQLELDPHAKVLEPQWPDPSHQVVAEVCRQCGSPFFDRDAGVCVDCEE